MQGLVFLQRPQHHGYYIQAQAKKRPARFKQALCNIRKIYVACPIPYLQNRFSSLIKRISLQDRHTPLRQLVRSATAAAFLMRGRLSSKNTTSFSNVRLKVYHFINVVWNKLGGINYPSAHSPLKSGHGGEHFTVRSDGIPRTSHFNATAALKMVTKSRRFLTIPTYMFSPAISHAHPSANAGETSKNLAYHICTIVHPLNNCRHLHTQHTASMRRRLSWITRTSCNVRRLPCSFKITCLFLKYAFHLADPPFNAAISMNGNGHRRVLIINYYSPGRLRDEKDRRFAWYLYSTCGCWGQVNAKGTVKKVPKCESGFHFWTEQYIQERCWNTPRINWWRWIKW